MTARDDRRASPDHSPVMTCRAPRAAILDAMRRMAATLAAAGLLGLPLAGCEDPPAAVCDSLTAVQNVRDLADAMRDSC